ncbi:MAG: hypothetical protein KatS3mg043_0518 [Rhodothermaceae bacterium]|nr:MAG: hypothetical protein KatS3mg043_0518 [Rhodothermaceae bacterium]
MVDKGRYSQKVAFETHRALSICHPQLDWGSRKLSLRTGIPPSRKPEASAGTDDVFFLNVVYSGGCGYGGHGCLYERSTCSRGSGRVARPAGPGCPRVAADLDALRVPPARALQWAGGRTHKGCGYIALHNDAFNSMDQRYMKTYPCQPSQGEALDGRVVPTQALPPGRTMRPCRGKVPEGGMGVALSLVGGLVTKRKESNVAASTLIA